MSHSQNHPRTSMAIDLTEFRRGWRILILAMSGILTSVSTTPLFSFGSLVLPLQDAFGWSRAEIQPSISFLFVAAVVSVQISGWLIRRYGLRPVTVASLLALSLGYMLVTFISGPIWQLYVAYTLLAFAGMGTTTVTWTQLVNLWFDRNRGLALAFILCGSGLAAFILPPLISWAIGLWGWRAGFWVLGALPLLLTLPLAVYWMSSNAPAEQAVHRQEASRPRLPGHSLSETARSKRFWLCNLALLFSVTSMVGMVTSTVPMLRDKGLSSTDAAIVFSVFGITLIVGRMLVGYLVDRVWAPGVAFVVLALPAVGCLIFSATGSNMLILMLASTLVGLGAGAEMDIAAFLMARYFGMRDYSRVFSLHMGIIGLGAALAPFYFAYLYSLSGSYSGMLLHCSITFALSAVLILAMGRYPKFQEKSVYEAEIDPVQDGAGAALSRS